MKQQLVSICVCVLVALLACWLSGGVPETGDNITLSSCPSVSVWGLLFIPRAAGPHPCTMPCQHRPGPMTGMWCWNSRGSLPTAGLEQQRFWGQRPLREPGTAGSLQELTRVCAASSRGCLPTQPGWGQGGQFWPLEFHPSAPSIPWSVWNCTKFLLNVNLKCFQLDKLLLNKNIYVKRKPCLPLRINGIMVLRSDLILKFLDCTVSRKERGLLGVAGVSRIRLHLTSSCSFSFWHLIYLSQNYHRLFITKAK